MKIERQALIKMLVDELEQSNNENLARTANNILDDEVVYLEDDEFYVGN